MGAKVVLIDGGDFVGKTTAIHALKRLIESRTNMEVLVVREPGGSPTGEDLREAIWRYGQKLPNRMKACLFYASKICTLQETTLPLLKKNIVIIYDRFNLVTLAYQGVLANDLEYIKDLDKSFIGTVLEDSRAEVSKFLLKISDDQMQTRLSKVRIGNSYDPVDVEDALTRQQVFLELADDYNYDVIDNSTFDAAEVIFDKLFPTE